MLCAHLQCRLLAHENIVRPCNSDIRYRSCYRRRGCKHSIIVIILVNECAGIGPGATVAMRYILQGVTSLQRHYRSVAGELLYQNKSCMEDTLRTAKPDQVGLEAATRIMLTEKSNMQSCSEQQFHKLQSGPRLGLLLLSFKAGQPSEKALHLQDMSTACWHRQPPRAGTHCIGMLRAPNCPVIQCALQRQAVNFVNACHAGLPVI